MSLSNAYDKELDFNFLTSENNCRIINYSSQTKGCPASNILSSDRKAIWLSEGSVPQFVVIDIGSVIRKPRDYFKYFGIYCWHAYSTNPKVIEIQFSKDNRNFKSFGKYCLMLRPGTQFFEIKNSKLLELQKYRYVKILVKETYGGNRTYLNCVYLFDELSGVSAVEYEKTQFAEKDKIDDKRKRGRSESPSLFYDNKYTEEDENELQEEEILKAPIEMERSRYNKDVRNNTEMSQNTNNKNQISESDEEHFEKENLKNKKTKKFENYIKVFNNINSKNIKSMTPENKLNYSKRLGRKKYYNDNSDEESENVPNKSQIEEISNKSVFYSRENEDEFNKSKNPPRALSSNPIKRPSALISGQKISTVAKNQNITIKEKENTKKENSEYKQLESQLKDMEEHLKSMEADQMIEEYRSRENSVSNSKCMSFLNIAKDTGSISNLNTNNPFIQNKERILNTELLNSDYENLKKVECYSPISNTVSRTNPNIINNLDNLNSYIYATENEKNINNNIADNMNINQNSENNQNNMNLNQSGIETKINNIETKLNKFEEELTDLEVSFNKLVDNINKLVEGNNFNNLYQGQLNNKFNSITSNYTNNNNGNNIQTINSNTRHENDLVQLILNECSKMINEKLYSNAQMNEMMYDNNLTNQDNLSYNNINMSERRQYNTRRSSGKKSKNRLVNDYYENTSDGYYSDSLEESKIIFI